jgi:RNA polymerase sigma factor (sigma-70 family)
MPMAPDNELLDRWLKSHSDEDFTELVRRHLALVHSAALRVVNGDRHLAEDVTQTVFADLARKARSLRDRPSLAGWLHQSARRAAMGQVRGEVRRRQREQETHSMPTDSSADAPAWSDLQPVIDDAVGDLSAKDREALLLRFFENRSHREIGELLGLNDNAARMRVERALDKVRRLLAKRGVTSSTSGLAAALLAHASLGTASLTAAQITATAVTASAAVGSGFTLLHLMTATQLKTGLAVTALVAGLTVPIVLQHHAIADLKSGNASLAARLPRIAELEAENSKLRRQVVDRAELETLRLEHGELLNLRSDAAALKQENLLLAQKSASLSNRLEAKLREEEENAALEKEKEVSIAKMGYGKMLSFAAIIHAQAHGGSLPASMADLRHTLETEKKAAGASKNLAEIEKDQGIKPDQFELVLTGDWKLVKNPAEAILFRELQPWKTRAGKWARAYAFVDGHSEVVTRDKPEEFETFELQHLPTE